jgi:hypothetical protein
MMIAAKDLPWAVDALEKARKASEQGTPGPIREYFETYFLPPKTEEEKYSHDLNQKILMSEARNLFFEYTLRGGQIELVRTTNVLSESAYSEPYKAEVWQIPAPIYYFQGNADLFAPHTSALAHYEGQARAPFKEFVGAIDGGHAPTQQLDDASRKMLLDAIFNGEEVPLMPFRLGAKTLVSKAKSCRNLF